MAVGSIIPIVHLSWAGTNPTFAGVWILIGHTLLFPAHGFLYNYALPFRWFWWLHIPAVIVLAGAGTLGFIDVWESISVNLPQLHWAIIANLAVHAPLFAMAILYLAKFGAPDRHQPNNNFNTDAGKTRAG